MDQAVTKHDDQNPLSQLALPALAALAVGSSGALLVPPAQADIVKIRQPIHERVVFQELDVVLSFEPNGKIKRTNSASGTALSIPTKRVQASREEELRVMSSIVPRISRDFEGSYKMPSRVCFTFSNELMRRSAEYLKRPNIRLLGDGIAHIATAAVFSPYILMFIEAGRNLIRSARTRD